MSCLNQIFIKMLKKFCILFVTLSGHLIYGASYEKYYDQAYKIAESMSLQQKIGQTIQTDFYTLTEQNVSSNQFGLKYHIGCVYNAGYGCVNVEGNMIDLKNMSDQQLQLTYAKANSQSWKKLTQKCNYQELVTTNQGIIYSIRPFLGTNAMHGDQHVAGNIVFPHNIGLSCSHNQQNFYNMGYWTASSMKKYGFNFVLAPTVALSHNPQWGRFYESMGQQSQYVQDYASSFVEGLQGDSNHSTGILACAKHFFADGATYWGSDEGNAHVLNFTTFINNNVKGFKGGIKKGLGSVMVSYSAINFMPLAGGPFLNGILRYNLQFSGFVLSDNNHIQKMSQQTLPTSFQTMRRNESVVTMFAAGIDMQIIPPKDEVIRYFKYVKQSISKNHIPIERLNDAVARIISVKLLFGIVQKVNNFNQSLESNQNLNHKYQHRLHKATEYEDSLNAVHESLVLLKNDNVLPIDVNKIKYIILAGEKVINVRNQGKYKLFQNYDNIGMQCGGWTFQFQGFNGNTIWTGVNKRTSNASSILDALKDFKNTLKQNQQFEILYPDYKSFTDFDEVQKERNLFLDRIRKLKPLMNSQNSIILSVIGQSPYAQMVGDINIPYCQNPELYNKRGCIWYPGAYLSKQPNSLEINFNHFQEEIIQQVNQNNQKIPLATVLISGRPMIINKVLEKSSCFISALLPGTSGGHGIVDSLVGNYRFRANKDNSKVNTLSFDWPKAMQSLSDFPYYDSDGQVPRIKDPLFQIGYGLSTKIKYLSE